MRRVAPVGAAIPKCRDEAPPAPLGGRGSADAATASGKGPGSAGSDVYLGGRVVEWRPRRRFEPQVTLTLSSYGCSGYRGCRCPPW